MGFKWRVFGATLITAVVSFGLSTRAPSGTAASARICNAHTPTTPADFQAIADGRSATFGVGDITSGQRLPDGRRFIAFGDTAYYNVNANGSAGPMVGFGNNSAWVQSGNCFTLVNRAGPGARSWILPPQADGSVYWPGASVVVGARLYVFLGREVLDQLFGRNVGAAVAIFTLPNLQLARLVSIPNVPKRMFGIGAVSDGGFIYTYASQLPPCQFCFSGDLYVARVRADEIQDPGAWQYRTHSGWTSDRFAAQPVLNTAVTNANVQRYGNGFLLVTKTFGFAAPDVEAWFAPAPDGPWQDLGTVYNVPNPPPSHVGGYTYTSAFTYNPVVYTDTPLNDGGYLASYNLSSFDAHEGQIDGRMLGPRFFSMHLPAPPAAPPRDATAAGPSPWTPTYGVDRFGRVQVVSGTATLKRAQTTRAVGVARTATGRGGWVATADGGVLAFGDAPNYGSKGGTRLNQPIVGIAATPTGKGYWLVARDGGIFAFGDARYRGSTGGIRLNQQIVAMTPTPTGNGYWLAARDGGVFTFGDARFFGSAGNRPPPTAVSGIAATPDGRGYWLITLAGQVYSYGDAVFGGNAPQLGFSIGIVAAPGGYRVIDTSGNVFTFGATHSQARIASSAPLVAAG